MRARALGLAAVSALAWLHPAPALAQQQFIKDKVSTLIKKVGVLSPERLALVVMRDWGLEDEDIGEIFSRPTEWATAVRANAERIKAREPIKEVNHVTFMCFQSPPILRMS